MFMTGPAIQSYFIQRSPESSGMALSINTSMTHIGLAAGAGTGGVLFQQVSTLHFHPWLAAAMVGIGLGIAYVGYAGERKRRSQLVMKDDRI